MVCGYWLAEDKFLQNNRFSLFVGKTLHIKNLSSVTIWHEIDIEKGIPDLINNH